MEIERAGWRLGKWERKRGGGKMEDLRSVEQVRGGEGMEKTTQGELKAERGRGNERRRGGEMK